MTLRILYAIKIAAVCAVFYWSNSVLAQQNPPCVATQTLSVAQRFISHQGEVIAQERVHLPDVLPFSARRPDMQVRYRLDVAACAQAADTTLYSYRVGAPYAVLALGAQAQADAPRALTPWLPRPGMRDNLLHSLGSGTTSLNGRVPAVFALPKGTRYIDFELRAMPYIPAGLTLVQLGNDQTLAAQQVQDYQGLSYAADLVAGLSTLLGVLAVLLGLKRERDMGLRWFALGCAAWGMRNLLYLNPLMVGDGYVVELFLSYGVALCGMAMAAAALYACIPMRAHDERVLRNAVAALTLLNVASVPLPVLAPVARIAGLLLTTGVIVWAVWLMARSKQPVRGVSQGVRYFLMAALLLLLVLGLHDFGIVLSLRPPTSPVLAFWGFSGVVLALAVLSSARVVDALNLAQNANAELELRIDEKSQQLERFYAKARVQELGRASDTARTRERERMAREMHDGLGAQLITALRGVERGGLSKEEVAEALQDGLDELRLLMDSSDVGRSLHGALAAWRNRWDPRLTAAGLTLHWDVMPGLEGATLSEDAVLQLMRILQEAVTNAMKHAQCDRVTVHVAHEEGMLWLSVTDNGVGINLSTAQQASQRGLRHIALRAAQLGAQHSVLPLNPPAHGTQVRVGLRVESA